MVGDFQVLYFDLRGHGRSDRSSAGSWNMRTWADGPAFWLGQKS
ncbi:MAG: hypothetical protein ABSA93_33505 [Streptosporangiaceae bacterium]